MHTTEVKFGPITAAAASIGAGMGAILDMAIFHQIFQLHQMLSAKIGNDQFENLTTNIFWDGIFQLLALTLITVGVIALWRLNENPFTPRADKTFFGSLILGWGLFITMEGIISHILLEIHHVVEWGGEDSMLFWDVFHIMIGVGIIGLGKYFISQGKKKFFKAQVKKARWKSFRFRPAFNRKSYYNIIRKRTLPSTQISGHSH